MIAVTELAVPEVAHDPTNKSAPVISTVSNSSGVEPESPPRVIPAKVDLEIETLPDARTTPLTFNRADPVAVKAPVETFTAALNPLRLAVRSDSLGSSEAVVALKLTMVAVAVSSPQDPFAAFKAFSWLTVTDSEENSSNL